jgi:UDP-N-acetylenolpyruvoylglucosamine reductase
MKLLRLSDEPLGVGEALVVDRAMRVADLHVDLQRALSKDTVLRRDEPMNRRTTLRVGGPADLYVEPVGEEELTAVVDLARVLEVPLFVLGRGSNLLIRDGGIRGVVVSLGHPSFSRIEIREGMVWAGAGAGLRQVANAARDAGLGGMEFMEGIPGSVGGALRMNAGAMGGWIFDRVELLRYMEPGGVIREITGAEAGAQYRGCPVLVRSVALGALLRGDVAERATIQERMAASNRKRWSSQPRQPSAGCTFKNPAPELPAGRLIDELGLKGMRVGNAMVSDIHGNFLVNLGEATSGDVLRLIEQVRQRVREARGIELETEVEIVGEDEVVM